jgi:type I restriction enzyme S subunit
MSDALPPGWAETRFGGVTVNHDGRRVPVKAADRASRRGKYRYFGAQGVIDYIDDYLFDGTYLLIAEDGANLASRTQSIAQIATGQFWVNNHAHIVEAADGMSLSFLKHFLNGNPLHGAVRGTAQPKLTQADLNGLRTPVPPTAEQDRIVAAIEEQFSRLDAGVTALERVRQSLKRMRGAVLQGAVTDALGCTDQGMTSLANLLSAPLANGKSVPDGPDNGFPVLRLTAVRDGWVDVTCSKKGAWTADEAKPYVIRKGDYLVVRGNGSKHLVGRGAMVGVDSEVAYPDTLIRLRFDEAEVVPRYAALMWNSRTVRNQIEDAARTTAGIYKINQKDLARITFPVPSIEDQVRIYASADSALYAVGVLEAQLDAQLQRSIALRSSILAAAFSGKLVSQDARDEPASALLNRIAAERTASNGHEPPPTRKPRTSQEKVTS